MDESPCTKEIAGLTRAHMSSDPQPNRRFLRKDCREVYMKSKGLTEQNRQMESLNYWKCQFSDSKEMHGVQPPGREEYFVRIRKVQGRKDANKKGVDSPTPNQLISSANAANKTATFLKKLSPIQNSPQFQQHFLNRQPTAPFLTTANVSNANGLGPLLKATGKVHQGLGLRSPPTSSMHHMDLRRTSIGHTTSSIFAPIRADGGENDYPMASGNHRVRSSFSHQQQQVPLVLVEPKKAEVVDEEDDLIFPIEI